MLEKPNKFVKSEKIEISEPKKWKRSEALKIAQKKYYEKNKKKLVEDQLKYNYDYVRKHIKCECGDTFQYSAKYLHLRSDRHKRRMLNIAKGIPAGHQPCNSSYQCVCGSSILHKNRTQHFKSAKHQKYLKCTMAQVADPKKKTYVVRLERAVYGGEHGDIIGMETTDEVEFDNLEEARTEFNDYVVENVGEQLYLDEMFEDGDKDNLECRPIPDQNICMTIEEVEEPIP